MVSAQASLKLYRDEQILQKLWSLQIAMLWEVGHSYDRPLLIWPLTPKMSGRSSSVFQACFVRFWLGTKPKCEVGYRETLFSSIWLSGKWMSQSYGSQPPSFCWLLLIIQERKGRSRQKSVWVASSSRRFGARGRNLLVVGNFWLRRWFHVTGFFSTHFQLLEEER